jgi:hypothetical protein
MSPKVEMDLADLLAGIAAELLVQGLDQCQSLWAVDAVVNAFAFTSGAHQLLITQHCQMLRKSGLHDAQQILQLADPQPDACQSAPMSYRSYRTPPRLRC